MAPSDKLNVRSDIGKARARGSRQADAPGAVRCRRLATVAP